MVLNKSDIFRLEIKKHFDYGLITVMPAFSRTSLPTSYKRNTIPRSTFIFTYKGTIWFVYAHSSRLVRDGTSKFFLDVSTNLSPVRYGWIRLISRNTTCLAV